MNEINIVREQELEKFTAFTQFLQVKYQQKIGRDDIEDVVIGKMIRNKDTSRYNSLILKRALLFEMLESSKNVTMYKINKTDTDQTSSLQKQAHPNP